MQYGDLTEAQISKLSSELLCSVREPSFVVWIEGFGDPTEYIMEIDTEVSLEFPQGRGRLNIGRAIIAMSNEDRYFYSDGKSKIEKNARMKIWAGFDNLNIPIFTGIVYSVKPVGTSDVVILNCRDYMGLFQDVLTKGSQDPNNTFKLLVENFCRQVNIPAPNIASTSETTSVYTHPTFEEQSILSALEEVCSSVFYTAYFDEDGNLNAVEREHSTMVDWTVGLTSDDIAPPSFSEEKHHVPALISVASNPVGNTIDVDAYDLSLLANNPVPSASTANIERDRVLV